MRVDIRCPHCGNTKGRKYSEKVICESCKKEIEVKEDDTKKP